MIKNLIIVESPAKAKTIEKFLGKDYKVASSYGHIRDLPKGNHAIDIQNDFTPTYQITDDKKEVVAQLQKMTKDAEKVFLASDDDREGEAISWHLAEVLDLNDANTRRVVFREITKNAILNAFENPRKIDQNLVDAQQARRILDRLVGFELSPVLWSKVMRGLSAGRVQSVAVRLIVEREREIYQFKTKSSFRVLGFFLLDDNKVLQAELSQSFTTEEEANTFLEKCINAQYHIKSLVKKPAKKSPSPPFSTSTLQQEAARKLGFPVAMTMRLAQRLYEAGKITYMRTDSLNLSAEAQQNAQQYIVHTFGDQYAKPRSFKTKSQTAQEAHEAIRPTSFDAQNQGSNEAEIKLYNLIWKRAIASQMADAKLEQTTATISISTREEQFLALGEVILFDGFLKVYLAAKEEDDDEEEKGILPPLTEGQKLDVKNILAKERFTRHPPRYTEASLVKKLEELNIGRPSTYAPTISTIQKRDYVEKKSLEGKERSVRELLLENNTVTKLKKTEIAGAEKNKLFPTNTAMIVNDFLIDHFPNIINYSFTADVEKEFDDIALGKISWKQMIKDFYNPFHKEVENTSTLDHINQNKKRELGIDPKTGKKVFGKLGKYGAFVILGDENEEEKVQTASLKADQMLETLTLQEALELFKLPRELGTFEDETITVAIGRYGPYVRHKNAFTSLKRDQDPLKITLDDAITLILEKREQDANKYIKTFDEDANMLVLNGRFGPYIKFGKKNIKIPKDIQPESLTYEQCKNLAENPPTKSRFKKNKK